MRTKPLDYYSPGCVEDLKFWDQALPYQLDGIESILKDSPETEEDRDALIEGYIAMEEFSREQAENMVTSP